MKALSVRSSQIIALLAAGGFVSTLVYLIDKHSGPSVSSGGLAVRLVEVVLADLPNEDSVLGEPDSRWDTRLGGRLGPGRWAYYESSHGTSCAVVQGAWLELAGGPAVMINRKAPGGSGFKIGAPVSRLYEGARSLGWLREPKAGTLPDLRAGDIYGTTHPAVDKDGNKLSGEHVGTVLSAELAGDTLNIETGDGGQKDSAGREAAKRRKRTISLSRGNQYSDGSLIPAGTAIVSTPGVGNTKLAWWIRTGG